MGRAGAASTRPAPRRGAVRARARARQAGWAARLAGRIWTAGRLAGRWEERLRRFRRRLGQVRASFRSHGRQGSCRSHARGRLHAP
ncbi:hypothetical protein ACWCPS_11125 [Streptomyces mauvecolor]